MYLLPTFYTSIKGGYLEPWPANLYLDYDILDIEEGKQSFRFAGLVIHALFFGDKNIPHSIWNCLDGWVKVDTTQMPTVEDT